MVNPDGAVGRKIDPHPIHEHGDNARHIDGVYRIDDFVSVVREVV
jgi:hypothetical protein